MTLSIHKLTAGSGYDYLTRQVAAGDVTGRGHGSLADYYTAQGEAPGVWIGSGLAGLAGLNAGDEVTAGQMRYLFGAGMHPLTDEMIAAAQAAGTEGAGLDRVGWLGSRYRVYSEDVPTFQTRVARRITELNIAAGRDAHARVSLEEQASARTDVGRELFTAQYGRDPVDAREMASVIARHSRPRTRAVAGYDLTFSPVKSVSTLWAIADQPTARLIEQAHQDAVRDALTYLEANAVFTREGDGGIRQVEVRGLIAAAFTHRDSRAGDPDLHTHVAVANKVQTRDGGRWLAIDGRLIFTANVPASEVYNTRLEHHLTTRLRVRFAPRPGTDPRKRPIREIVGVDPALLERWSTRRAAIQARRTVLAQAFQAAHGRPPTPIEAIALAQQATLETREAKHEPRSLAQQRTTWAAQAAQTLGSQRAVAAMVDAALHPAQHRPVRVDAAWIAATAAAIAATVQSSRAHWQRWHVEAEAFRQVRGVDLAGDDIDRVVDLLVEETLTTHSLPLTRAGDGIDVPDALRRTSGDSVYVVARSQRFTSPAVLAAEARIVARAGQHDGARVGDGAIEAAITASARAGLPLNPGQASLVRDMATSRARVQLAIAPAGAGKTTAMAALADAWTSGGGTIIGLAPSAAAADVLKASTGTTTDTLAKLTWHLNHPGQDTAPAWAEGINAGTLVVIDEAGMADTLTLDTVIEHVTARGASVRLIGDDQQLAAVGAGGVLRDITATHGALHLSELMRFTTPAEAAASLALRDGLPEAVGFYLDQHRVHVADHTTLADHILTAWASDQAAGIDALMLAPTRDLTRDLNHRARTHRLTLNPALHDAPSVTLADGNTASPGDVVITRMNDRRLPTSATDWVKNGDRWTITALHRGGAVTVRHTRHHARVTLPASYVTQYLELGYACTIHTAQGVTAQACHTLLSGHESRQTLYTAATRGKDTNHLYLAVAGDGDEHSIIRPDTIHPVTAADILETILARDESATSATTIARDATTGATQLTDAVARYLDSLTLAAEHHVGADATTALHADADQALPGLTSAPAWGTLAAHLTRRAAHGHNPLTDLKHALSLRELDTATDPATVLDWRLDDTALACAIPGPLPWLPGIPHTLLEDPTWGRYLADRAARVRYLTSQIRTDLHAAQQPPGWARSNPARTDTDLVADVTIWRAATGVPDTDRRPTGPTAPSRAAHEYQQALNARLGAGTSPAFQQWRDTLTALLTSPDPDPYLPVLAEHLAALSRAGITIPTLLHHVLTTQDLPDSHQAAALWWRLAGHVSPAVLATTAATHHLNTAWTAHLPDLVGPDQAAELAESSWWPALVAAADRALAAGAPLETLFTHLPDPSDGLDTAQALTWRITLLTTPPPTQEPVDQPAGPGDVEPNPFWDDDPHPATWIPTQDEWADLTPRNDPDPGFDPGLDDAPVVEDTSRPGLDDARVDAILTWAAITRDSAGPLQPSDHEIETQLARAYDADTAPVTARRIADLNHAAATYYATCFPGSWAQTYLTARLGTDLTGDPHVAPGYAPPGWTHLSDHLRRSGATDTELLTAGLATTTRHGRLIDRFRDRLTLPITTTSHDGQRVVLGFIARANPHQHPNSAGPKYLNTPDTALFHKGAQLHITHPHLAATGAAPVLVEGPIDALAVTIAGHGRYIGLAPLGTSLTEEQAAQLATISHEHAATPVIAMDADPAGQIATHRAYWLLTQHALAPATITLRPGSDPADLLTTNGPTALAHILDNQTPLAGQVLQERLDHLDGISAVTAATTVLAAAHPNQWNHGITTIATTTDIPTPVVRRHLATQIQHWNHNPRAVVNEQLTNLNAVRDRLTKPALPRPATPHPDPAQPLPPAQYAAHRPAPAGPHR